MLLQKKTATQEINSFQSSFENNADHFEDNPFLLSSKQNSVINEKKK